MTLKKIRNRAIIHFRENRKKYKFSLESLYKAIGITKPAVLKMEKRMQKEQMMLSNLILIIMQIRKDHPTMGVRSMYYMICPEGIGRDKFELLCKEVSRSVRLYNESKPHISLHRMTPNEFEKTLYMQGQQSAIATEALDVI